MLDSMQDLPEKPTYEELEQYANEYAQRYSKAHAYIIETQKFLVSPAKYKAKVEALMERLMFLKVEMYEDFNQKES